MKNKVTYNCKQNDAVIRLFEENGKIGEIQVQIKGETSWTVIGFNDLQKAISKANKVFNHKGRNECASCGRPFVRTEAENKMFCCVSCDMGY